MELQKLKDTIAQLDRAIEKVANAKSSTEVNSADSEIGACLRSVQYGVGMVGIECKHMVENRQKELRGIVFTAPTPEVVAPVEEPSKTVKKKKAIAKKGKKNGKE